MSFEGQPKPDFDPVESKLGREIEETEESLWEALAMLDVANKDLLGRWAERQDLVASGADAAEETRLLRELEFFVSDLTDAAAEFRGRYEELRRKRQEYLGQKRERES